MMSEFIVVYQPQENQPILDTFQERLEEIPAKRGNSWKEKTWQSGLSAPVLTANTNKSSFRKTAFM
ncbi:MAG: hypothetical protein LBO00_09060 [Zoogloeaceae bacterium]|nr:hypothetical protein [Zoogloeaceae bacterium]